MKSKRHFRKVKKRQFYDHVREDPYMEESQDGTLITPGEKIKSKEDNFDRWKEIDDDLPFPDFIDPDMDHAQRLLVHIEKRFGTKRGQKNNMNWSGSVD